MKYLIWLFLTLFLVSCASSPKAGSNDSSAAADASDSKKVSAGKEAAKEDKKEASAASDDAIQCKWQTETRKIENKKTGEGCEVIYTKNGAAETVGSATSDLSVCENIAEKIQGNLESNGFKCSAI